MKHAHGNFVSYTLMTALLFTCTACAPQNWQDFTGSNRGYAEFQMDVANCQLQVQNTQVNMAYVGSNLVIGITAVNLLVQANTTFKLCMQAKGWQNAPQQMYYRVQVASNNYNNSNNNNNNDTSNTSNDNSSSSGSNDNSDIDSVTNQANRGDRASQYHLGLMYHNGIGVRRNDAEAAKWFYRSAEQGHNSAQKYLGMSYARGWGVRRN